MAHFSGRSCKPLLSPPKNGRILGICDNRVGQVCNFACNKGFKLKGYASVVCSSSQTWTSNPPVCVPLSCCPKLTPPFRGILEGSCGTNTNVGDKCYAQCETGTVLEGIKVLECLPGCIWNADPPICRSVKPIPVTCPKLYPPLFGSYFGSCSPGIPNRECYFKCSVGYYLVGSNSLTCTESGTWSTSIPYCQSKYFQIQ